MKVFCGALFRVLACQSYENMRHMQIMSSSASLDAISGRARSGLVLSCAVRLAFHLI